MIKIAKLAKDLGVTKATIYNWHLKGDIEFIKTNTNRNYVSVETYNRLLGIQESKHEYVVIYCRVSSSENKSNLETQKERLINYCNAKGYRVSEVITEIASGVNDQRPKLTKLIKNDNYTKIVVEHKDRLTRFGFNYFELFTEVLGKKIEVVNNTNSKKEDLIDDFMHCYTKLFNKKINKTEVEKLIKELSN